jgi:aryl-alcohol dehydrogenase-like predicted oxidoreductase
MQYVSFDGVHVPVSRVVLGTDWIGSRRTVHVAGRRVRLPLIDSRRQRQNFELLDAALHAGCTTFDTARAYDDSERSLGAWVRARGVRERVAIISKGAHPDVRSSRLTAAAISADLERSLRELQTDYIDVYLLHYDDPKVDVGPIVDVLNQHRRSGKIRAFGASNWRPARIEQADSHAANTRQASFSVGSVHFSLAVWNSPPWRSACTIAGAAAEADRQWYRAGRLWILAYSSLGMGFFSESRLDASGAYVRDSGLRDRVFVNPANLARLTRARQLARDIGATVGQIALAWVLAFDPKMLAVVGARKSAAYFDAAGACGIALSQSQRSWLESGTDSETATAIEAAE